MVAAIGIALVAALVIRQATSTEALRRLGLVGLEPVLDPGDVPIDLWAGLFLGTIDDLRTIAHDAIIVAIGDNQLRRALVDKLAGERLATAIHPFTSIARSARIGEGSMISAGAIVTPHAVIGQTTAPIT